MAAQALLGRLAFDIRQLPPTILFLSHTSCIAPNVLYFAAARLRRLGHGRNDRFRFIFIRLVNDIMSSAKIHAIKMNMNLYFKYK